MAPACREATFREEEEEVGVRGEDAQLPSFYSSSSSAGKNLSLSLSLPLYRSVSFTLTCTLTCTHSIAQHLARNTDVRLSGLNMVKNKTHTYWLPNGS